MSPRLQLVFRVANGPRESVNRVFRTAIDIVRTTPVLRRFVDADSMYAEIKSVAALAGLTIKYGKEDDHKEETTSKEKSSDVESLEDIDLAPEVSSHEFLVTIQLLTVSWSEPGLEIGEQVIMKVKSDEITFKQHFHIRAKRLQEDGNWQYQLMRADLTLYQDGEWCQADVLGPVFSKG
jgi:hypothetical protein